MRPPCQILLEPYVAGLRDHAHLSEIQLDNEFHKDLNWFLTFLSSFNRVTMYDIRPINYNIYLDACPLFIKAIIINRPLKPALPLLIDEPILLDIVQMVQTLDHPILFQALYLLCFLSFLRLPNILPHTASKFDITRHLCRGDLIFSPQNVVVLIICSKTLQDRRSLATVTIPALGSSALCHVRAITAMCQAISATTNQPLFLYHRGGSLSPLTD